MKFLGFVVWSILLIQVLEIQAHEDNNDDLIVELSHGKLRGKNHENYYSYESIPYAEPPVGDLRFEAPQPYQQNWPEIFDATVKPKECMQWNQFQAGEYKLTGVEDCLAVNVYKPKTGKDKYPVLIYIHGGAFMFGAANSYGEDLLMNRGNVMLVTMSYRLGPLGFLSTADESITGNFGLKDQQLALQWIKKNIAHFGGDPENIVLFGFSAGGASTHLQMLQPTLKNIAKAAISMSGVALSPWVISKNPQENALKLAKHLQCPNPTDTQQLKQCLKNKPAKDIVETVKEFLNFGYNPCVTFGPVVEHKNAQNAFITEHPKEIIKSGNYSHIPWLTSYAAQDGCYNAAELLQTDPKTGKPIMNNLNDKWLELAPENLFLKNIKDDAQAYAKHLKEQYLGNLEFSEENYLRVQEMYTDILFKNGLQEALKLHRLQTKAPVYSYVFNSPAEFNTGVLFTHRTDIKFGTCHGDDIALILSNPSRTLKTDEQEMSRNFMKMFEQFFETGDLTYADCKFGNNELLSIAKDKCETITQ